MNDPIDTLIKMRKKMMELMKGLSHEQLVTIPDGQRSSILWNLGHCVVTQQTLCYVRSGLRPHIDVALIERYGKGTNGDDADAADIGTIEDLLLDTAFQLQKDVASELFKNYDPLLTSLDVEIKSAAEAIEFNNIHEALHFGFARALRRAV